MWIRPTTGELCVDLVRDPETNFPLMWMEVPRIGNVSLNDPRAEALIISGLNDEDCHALCFRAPIAKPRALVVSTELPIWPTNIFCLNSQEWTLSKVSEPLDIDFDILKWSHAGRREEVANSWSRYVDFDTDSFPLLISFHFRGLIPAEHTTAILPL